MNKALRFVLKALNFVLDIKKQVLFSHQLFSLIYTEGDTPQYDVKVLLK